ncbi:hypothetical protein [Desulfolithobacter sp.]
MLFFLILDLGIFSCPPSAHSELLGLDASWRLSETGQDDQDRVSSLGQRYHAQWNPRISDAITLDTNINYSRTWTAGTGVYETLSPTANFLVRNDLFQAELNGLVNQTTNVESQKQTDQTWEASLTSNWQYDWWPTLSVSHGQNYLSDDETIHLVDNDRTWTEITAGWRYGGVNSYYSYYQQERNDSVENSTYYEKKHFGRLEYSRMLFDDRGQFSISEQITHSTTDFSAIVAAGQTIDISLTLSQGLAGVDDTPEDSSLPANPALIDGNSNTVAFTITPGQEVNLGIGTDYQRVDLLHVYTTQLDATSVSQVADLRWDLYTSDNGTNWQRVLVNPSTSYNQTDNRYEVITGGIQAIYMKLVVTAWPATADIPVTEITAFRTVTSTGDNVTDFQRQEKYLTDLNFRFDPSVNTRFSYSLVWDSSKFNLGNDRTRFFQSASFSWQPSRYFAPTLTVNNTDTINSDTTDTTTRSYGLNIRSSPTETLDTSLSVTRNENYQDGTRQSSNHTITLLTSAVLYPDLESSLDINVSFNKNEADKANTEETFSVRWSLTARLRPGLTADLVADYAGNSLDWSAITSNTDSGGKATLNINWRPSDLVSFQMNGSQGYGNQEDDSQSLLFDSKFSILRTRKTQVTVGYRTNWNQEATDHSLNTNLSWNISRYLTLQSLAYYRLTDDQNSWAINASLTARF